MHLIANQVTQLYITLVYTITEININSGALACSSLSCSGKNALYQSEYGKFAQALQCHTIQMAIKYSVHKSGSYSC